MKAIAVGGRHKTVVRGRAILDPGTQTSAPDMPSQREGVWRRTGQGETWNIEVRSVDIKAGGYWGVLLVLHLPVLWGKRGSRQDPQSRAPPTLLTGPDQPLGTGVLTWCR